MERWIEEEWRSGEEREKRWYSTQKQQNGEQSRNIHQGLEHSHHRRSHTVCLLMPLSMHTAGRGKLGQGLYSNRNGGKPVVVWRNTAHKHCTLWSVRGRERKGGGKGKGKGRGREGERGGEREREREKERGREKV